MKKSIILFIFGLIAMPAICFIFDLKQYKTSKEQPAAITKPCPIDPDKIKNIWALGLRSGTRGVRNAMEGEITDFNEVWKVDSLAIQTLINHGQ